MQAMKIKLCGLCRPEDISYVNEAAPDYAGFVFAKSRRQVSFEEAARLRGRLNSAIVPVGVFVNAPLALLVKAVREGLISIAQLHGSEDAAYIHALKEQAAVPVIKAVRVDSRRSISAALTLGSDYLLLDNGSGGTGERFDWELLKGDSIALERCFIAGGIKEQYIEETLQFSPYGLDVSSGVETDGVKDRGKMLRLVELIRKL
ncbi:phosphoribosylanthranilate isomerase [Breznakiellaceae bacterium SP9]